MENDRLILNLKGKNLNQGYNYVEQEDEGELCKKEGLYNEEEEEEGEFSEDQQAKDKEVEEEQKIKEQIIKQQETEGELCKKEGLYNEEEEEEGEFSEDQQAKDKVKKVNQITMNKDIKKAMMMQVEKKQYQEKIVIEKIDQKNSMMNYKQMTMIEDECKMEINVCDDELQKGYDYLNENEIENQNENEKQKQNLSVSVDLTLSVIEIWGLYV
ncbi:MAG: hypothetical protein EZS28_001452 [Streblomastix strix]|uniref:Uncharacterized protein n=1 Tax=Streblomastix strix TaxID=222440 RepID=A0A5J4X785_9EUKA|nr:MAG: hypothetical protein EZS28_001452 [Streblomastix strix]